jgi:hypothetical protein
MNLTGFHDAQTFFDDIKIEKIVSSLDCQQELFDDVLSLIPH